LKLLIWRTSILAMTDYISAATNNNMACVALLHHIILQHRKM
jgi:hypothetical protein